MFASTKTELRMPNAFYKPNTPAIPINSQHLQKWSQMITNPRNLLKKGASLVFWKAPMVSKHSISFYRKDLASQFRYWTFSPEVTPSSGTPLPDPGVRANFIQVVDKMTFWPSLHRHKQNYGCQMHFINQTPLQFPSIPNIFKNDHKWSQIPEIFSRKGHHWFFGKHPWLVSILFHSIEKIWPHNFDMEPFLLKSHLVLAHLCQIPASEQISFKLFIKWLSDHVCVDKDRITDAKCIL